MVFPLLSMVLGSFNHWIQWFSMAMDYWSNNAMVFMGHSHLKSHKDWNFKLADLAEEVDPGIWHRFFCFFCCNLEWAGDSFDPSEWCSCLCCQVDWSGTPQKLWRQKHSVNTQSSKEKRHPLESTIHHPRLKTFLLFASDMPTITPTMTSQSCYLPYLFFLQACLWNAD